MDNYTTINTVNADQTIISGLGFSPVLDISLANFNERGPSASSTAAPIKQREQYLQSCPDKENDYWELPKIPPHTQEKAEVLKDITQSNNVPENYFKFKENILSNSTENICREDNVSENISTGRSSGDSSGFNLYGGSSILGKSNLISFEDEIDELDLKKGATNPLGLPSFLIGDPDKELDREPESFGIWGDDDQDQGDGHRDEEIKQDFKETELKSKVDLIGKSSAKSFSTCSMSLAAERFSEPKNPFTTAVNFNQEIKRSDELLDEFNQNQNEFEDEEFHSLNHEELDAAEQALNKDKFLMMSNVSCSDKSDLSGFINPKDISVQPSLWNIGTDVVKDGRKLNVEDILTAKSEKLGSLDGCKDEMPSFGFEKSDLKSPSKYDYQNETLDSTLINPSKIFYEEPISVSPVPLDQNYKKNSSPLPKIKINDFSLCTKESAGMHLNVPSKVKGEPALPSATKNESSIDSCTEYMTILRKIVEKASASGDPKKLVEEMLRYSKKEESTVTSESLLDMSTDVMEMRNYRENLQKDYKESNRYMKSQSIRKNNVEEVKYNNRQCLNVHDEKAKAKSRMKMGTSTLKSPSTTVASSQHDKRHQLNSVVSDVKNLTLSTTSSARPSKSNQIITKSCLTGIKTIHECSVKNPTSRTLIASVNKLDEMFHSSSSLKPQNKNSFVFEYAASRILNPNSCISIPFGFCSLLPGSYIVKLELKLCQLEASNEMRCIWAEKVQLYFEIYEPNVGIACGRDAYVDFGLVPEYCTVKKEVELINHSSDPIPVLINLKTLCHSNEIFLRWDNKVPRLKLLAPTLAACELPKQSSIKVILNLHAPSVEYLKGRGIVKVVSELEMILDSPSSNTVLARVPIKVLIGEVLLRASRNKIPVTVESVAGKTGSSTFTLRSKSMFTLNLSAKIFGHESLSVSPKSIAVPPEKEVDVQINFTPTPEMENAKLDGKLIFMVEPEGLLMELPLVALSSPPALAPQDVIESLPIEVESEKAKETRSEEKALITQSVCLSSSACRFAFGSLSVGETSSRTLLLQNGWSENSLHLQVSVVDSEDFYLLNENDKEKLFTKEVQIPPNQKLSIIIHFAPSVTGFFKGSLVCKCKGVVTASKAVFPLYGFGGSGNLILQQENNTKEEKELLFGKVVPGTPSILKVLASNSGSRFIFVKFRILADEFSDRAMSWVDICVQPPEFVLSPGESKDILVITTGSPDIMRLAPGRIGYFQVIYGDEILRRRFRRLKDKHVRERKVNDARLLKINFDDSIHREKLALTEVDDYPSFPEDALIFYNCCKISNIPLCCEIDADAEVSASMIDVELDQDTLMCSFVNRSTTNVENREELRIGLKNNPSLKSPEFDVFPPQLKLVSSQKYPSQVSLVNFSAVDQILEVLCENNWLKIAPREFTVAPKSFRVVQVELLTANLSRNTPKITNTSFQILGQNHQKEVKVILEIDSQITKEKFLQNQPSKIPTHRKSSNEPSKSAGSQEPSSGSPSDRRHLANKMPPSKTSQRLQSDRKVNLEIGDELNFPTTSIFKESAIKLSINNFESCDYQIKIVSSCKHYFVRHTNNVTVKGKHCVQIPIYFRPKERGEWIEYISVHLLELEQTHQVKLRGKAQ